MDTIEELKYYCNELQPVGALMLTGEWGCGKTYLLNNILTEAIKDTHIILRVSLFGIESIEEVHKEVKKNWLYAFAELEEPIAGISETIKKFVEPVKLLVKKSADHLPAPVKTVADGVLSLNVLDFIRIESQMGEKKVVLVFDDLERANISTSDLLGCINEYCENLHINTIVVANEEKIKSSEKDKIQYDEIKEKIIQRTIRYSPNYSAVVSSVINSMVCENGDAVSEAYKSFLRANGEMITSIFSGASVDDIPPEQLISKKYSGNSREELESEKENIQELLKHRPHNIRSLKCAIQDFRRIYSLLDEKHINNKEKWLFTYLSYVLCFRAGLIPEGPRYGTLFSDEKVSVLYSGFYSNKYITSGIKQWVRYGEWSKDILDAELDYIMNKDKAIAPEEKVRMNRILDLEEADIRAGYPLLLQKAYDGALELNDYVNLICNSYLARTCDMQLTVIDWEKICRGIRTRIEKMIQAGDEKTYYHRTIDEGAKESFLPEEWNAYKIIDEFLSTNSLMFEKNKAFYVKLMRTEPMGTLIQTQNKRFNIFDIEMAEATADGFERSSNAEKSDFIDCFEGMWQANICTPDYEIKSAKNGFRTLKSRMLLFLNKCKADSLPISAAHTNRFLKVIDNLIDEQEKKMEEANNKEKNNLL